MRGIDAWLLGGLAVLLLLWFLWPFLARGHGVPVGPDIPVYLWWTRLAGAEGLSAVGHRPGVTGVALVLAGSLGRSVVETLAALEVVLGTSAGLAAAALLRGRTGRGGWLLAGALTGTFATHLATGYLANLTLAVLLLAAARALVETRGRGSAAAAGLLAAGGLAHPLFLLLGGAILGLSALLALRYDEDPTARDEARRIGAAVAGGTVIAGLGLGALLVGPDPLAVDTSRDGFLRRAGLGDVLRGAYLERLVHRWARYVQWASVPLAVLGLPATRGFLRRFLGSWAIVLVVGAALALATGWAPADRFITFGFVVPILAALGLVWLWHALEPHRPLALAATGALTLAMLAGAFFAWNRQEPFLSDLEAERLATANRVVAATEPGTAVVVWVNEDEGPGTFLATRAGNLVRASVPPGRIRDVVVFVPEIEGSVGEERGALSRVSRRDVALAVRRAEGRRVDLLLAPFDRIDLEVAQRERRWTKVGTGVFVLPAVAAAPEPEDPLETSNPAAIALAALLSFALVGAIGYGWSRATLADALDAAALAPAFGVAAAILGAVVLDLLGGSLGGTGGPVAVSAPAGGGGYLLRYVLERRARARSAP